MLALTTAQKLKSAGLTWTPALHDFFALPDRGMDDRVFVLSDMSVDVERLKGRSIVTFNGTSEWALDYEMMSEVVWLPTEEQLRALLEQRLPAPAALKLIRAPDGYWVEIKPQDKLLGFRGASASEAYADALLYLLEANR
jgi:hypothetical protein